MKDTQTFKQEYYIQTMNNGFWIWFRVAYREEIFICSITEKETADLICEALNLKLETGLTPSQLQSDLAKQKQVNSELLEVVKTFLILTKESTGVSGWHLNGDIAEWSEFDLIKMAKAAISTHESTT